MRIVRNVYEHPRAVLLGVLIGVLLIATGAALDEHLASSLRAFGIAAFVAAANRANTLTLLRAGHAAAHRDGYRRGRRVGRPVVVRVGQDVPGRHSRL